MNRIDRVSEKIDFIGLSTEEKQTDVANGSTFWEVDTSKFYIFYKGTWYEQK